VAEVLKAWVILMGLWALPVHAVDVVNYNPRARCQKYALNSDLNVYRDPSLYASNVGLLDVDPSTGLNTPFNDSPLLTTVRGVVYFMELGPPQEFKDFRAILKLFEIPQPRIKRIGRDSEPRDDRWDSAAGIDPNLAVPIRFCGKDDPYSDTLGYVFLWDRAQALKDPELKGETPPSIAPNPIPHPRLGGG